MVSFFKRKPYILFLLPAFFLYTLFSIYPLVFVIPFSFVKWGGTGPIQFAGFQNFISIFGNSLLVSQLGNAYKNVFYRLVLNFGIIDVLLIPLAYMIYRKIPGGSFFKTVIFMPNFVNSVAIVFMVTLFFSPGFGLYGIVMKAIGLGQYANPGIWVDPKLGVPLTVLVSAWRTTGYELLLFIASFNTVPTELDDAARIDGAGELSRFFHIFLPLSKPTLINILVIQYIASLLHFDMAFMLGGIGGGPGGNMDTVMLFFYRNIFGGGFVNNFVGAGSALSMVIVIPIVVGVLLINWLFGRGEEPL